MRVEPGAAVVTAALDREGGTPRRRESVDLGPGWRYREVRLGTRNDPKRQHFRQSARALAQEEATVIALAGASVERIVSTGQASPPGFWYDQDWTEWVIVLEGAAGLLIEGEGAARRLERGDSSNPAKDPPSGGVGRLWTDRRSGSPSTARAGRGMALARNLHLGHARSRERQLGRRVVMSSLITAARLLR